MADVTTVQDKREVDLNDARPRRWGWWLLIAGFGGFLTWALLAPLDAGVSAPGAVLAKDGDDVKAGQTLVRLDDTQSRSQLDISQGQWLISLATQARLEAERLGRAVPDFPAALLTQKSDPRASAAMGLQTQLLVTRRAALNSELAAMAETIRGLELQTQGTETSRQAKDDQLRLLREQLKNQRELADEGFLPRNRVLEQERTVASMQGAMAEDLGSIGRNRQSMAEIKTRMATRQQEVRKEVETQLADTQRDASTLKSRLEALQFDLANTEIKAPSEGLVMGLAVHTVGGVVAAGSPMMEIVPKGQSLRIDAQIPPNLIDKVRPGLPVNILFTAFNQVSTPRIPGTVLTVSADVLTEPRQNLPYFKATIEVTTEGMVKLKKNEVRAGMPVEVFVRTGERTAMSYFIKPLLDRTHRALNEP
jgi:membrane fusion protein, protease secretion system